MKVSGYKLKPLERQAEEAAKFTGLKFLNRRGEWGQNLPPKLALEENLSKSQGGKRKPKENKKKSVKPTEESTLPDEEKEEKGEIEDPQSKGAEHQENLALRSPPKKRPNLGGHPKKSGGAKVDIAPPPRSKSLSVKEILNRMKEMKGRK